MTVEANSLNVVLFRLMQALIIVPCFHKDMQELIVGLLHHMLTQRCEAVYTDQLRLTVHAIGVLISGFAVQRLDRFCCTSFTALLFISLSSTTCVDLHSVLFHCATFLGLPHMILMWHATACQTLLPIRGFASHSISSTLNSQLCDGRTSL